MELPLLHMARLTADSAVTGFIWEAPKSMEHDKIKCHGKGTYRVLQFRVTGSAVQFDRINVVYGNHTSEPLPFRFRVAPGGGREIDLRGGERDIAYVEFWYQKASWGSRPEVRLYGKP